MQSEEEHTTAMERRPILSSAVEDSNIQQKDSSKPIVESIDVSPVTQASKIDWRECAAVLASGVLFGAGLSLSGMAGPSKVIDFLNLSPNAHWDPSLAMVMGGAVAVTAVTFPFVLDLKKPFLKSKFSLPTKVKVDTRLVIGAALFGLGWGLAGVCPGPSIVGLAHGAKSLAVFVASMITGMLIHDKFFAE